jgi:hypothetical protein
MGWLQLNNFPRSKCWSENLDPDDNIAIGLGFAHLQLPSFNHNVGVIID